MFKQLACENKNYRNLIDGKWQSTKTNNLIEIKSPIDDSLVGRIQSMSKEEVDFAINSAKEAQKDWRIVPVNERAEILYKAADILEREVEEISRIMILEVAKDKKVLNQKYKELLIILDLLPMQQRVWREKVYLLTIFQVSTEVRYLLLLESL